MLRKPLQLPPLNLVLNLVSVALNFALEILKGITQSAMAAGHLQEGHWSFKIRLCHRPAEWRDLGNCPDNIEMSSTCTPSKRWSKLVES